MDEKAPMKVSQHSKKKIMYAYKKQEILSTVN